VRANDGASIANILSDRKRKSELSTECFLEKFAVRQVLEVLFFVEILAWFVAWCIAQYSWKGMWIYVVIASFGLLKLTALYYAKKWLFTQPKESAAQWRFWVNLLLLIVIQLGSVAVIVYLIFGNLEWGTKGLPNFGFNYFWGGLVWVLGVLVMQWPLSNFGQKAFWNGYFAFLIAWVILFCGFYHLGGLWSGKEGVYVFAALCVMDVFGLYFAGKLVLGGLSGIKKSVWRFWLIFQWSIIIQLAMLWLFVFIIFDVFDLKNKKFVNFSFGSIDFDFFVFGFFVVFIIYCMQFSLARSAQDGAEMLRKVGGLVLAFLVGVAFIPPVSNVATEKILSATASGNRSCVMFILAVESPAIAPEIQLGSGSFSSKALRILAEIDGYYLVRKYYDVASSNVLYFVPRNLVAGFKDCQGGVQATDTMVQ